MFELQSAALILVDGAGRIFCIQELQSKPHIGKIVGRKDYSVPWETVERTDDGRYERLWLTVHRAVREEVDATDSIEFEFPVCIGQVTVHESTANVFVAKYRSGPNVLRGTHAGTEVEPLGWLTREELLVRPRDGIREILELWDRYRSDCAACR